MSGSSSTFSVSPNAERATCNRYVLNAIYSDAPGAQLVSDSSLGGDVWVIDCTAEINMTFKIGSSQYDWSEVASNGDVFCYGTVRVTSPQSSVC